MPAQDSRAAPPYLAASSCLCALYDAIADAPAPARTANATTFPVGDRANVVAPWMAEETAASGPPERWREGAAGETERLAMMLIALGRFYRWL